MDSRYKCQHCLDSKLVDGGHPCPSCGGPDAQLAPAPLLEEVKNIIKSWKMDEEDTAWLLRQFAALSRSVAELQDKVTNRDAQLVTQAGAHMLAMTGARCDLSAERAKSARLGSAKEKLAKRLHDTRVKLAKVECEATVHYEDMRRMRKRLEALEKALRWAAPFLPKDGTIDVTVQSALSATEVEHA